MNSQDIEDFFAKENKMNHKTCSVPITDYSYDQNGVEYRVIDSLEITPTGGERFELTIRRNVFIDGVYSSYESHVFYSTSVDDESLERIHRLTAL